MIEAIINADDFGLNDEVNNAIVFCFEHNLISNTTIIPNMPTAEKAIELAKYSGFFDCVGLHLNLREGEPLTAGISGDKLFCDENGKFKMSISPFRRYFTSVVFLRSISRKHLLDEIDAQMDWYAQSGFCEMHLDSHQSIHTWYFFLSAIKPLFNRYSFKTMRKRVINKSESIIKKCYRAFINKQIKNPVKNLYDIKTFVENYSKLAENECCEVMCHPVLQDGIPVDALSGIPIETVSNLPGIVLKSYSQVL